MNVASRLWWTAKGVGWENVPRRLLQVVRVRSGLLRKRLAVGHFSDETFRAECNASLDDQPKLWARRAKRFLPGPTPESLQAVANEELWDRQVIAVCEKALAGDYLFFSHWYGRLGWPPDFQLDPMHNVRWPTGRHWLDGPDSLGGQADIKLVWEASRFSLAYYFARAYARSGDARWAEAFWTMFDAWGEQNPPQLTVAWQCGQEMTFRLMAMLFGAAATRRSDAATPRRLYALSRLAWQTGRHISININAALGQKNNHGLSEAVGLFTIALLFPEFPSAADWARRGRRTIAAEMRREVYDDGSFVQHSMNYHRVMMDDMLWAVRLGERAGQPLPAAAVDRFRRATNWLWEMIDSDSGFAPNYGSNDGAFVLPLSCCDYRDFRPVVQAAHYLLHGKRCFPPGPWDEKMLHLAGPQALDAPVEAPTRKAVFQAPDGGYYILRGPNSWLMTRCHAYRDRPGQCDMLHVDLWYKGVNILRDAGTYLYNCQGPWKDYFYSTAAHNTVTVDGRDQMVKGPRFLWMRWTKSRLLRLEGSPDGRIALFAGEHTGYETDCGVTHRRAICRIDDLYVIVDDLLGGGARNIALRWRLAPGAWRKQDQSWRAEWDGQAVGIAVLAPAEMSVELLDSDAPPPAGCWESLHYGEKQPALAIVARGKAILPTGMITLVGPAERVDDLARALAGRAADAKPHLNDVRDVELSGFVARLMGQSPA